MSNKRNAYELANDASVTTPDALDSYGSLFLLSVQDAVFEWFDDNTDATQDDARDAVGEMIDGLVPIYTYQKWMTFVDLAAWQEDLSDLLGSDSDYGDPDSMLGFLSDLALNQIADRLAFYVIENYEREVPPHWHIGSNMPGYLPENDMHEVGYLSHVEAKCALIEEMDCVADALQDGGETGAAEELSSLMEDVNLLTDGEEWSCAPVANVIWYLQSSTESFTCDSDCEVQ